MDTDGRVNSVTRVDCTPNKTIVSYGYGSGAGNNGQPVQIIDGLSGVEQDITYATTGANKGLPVSVVETNGSSSYTVEYTYLDSGERSTARYWTPNSDNTWRYSDYILAGSPENPQRVFQTLNKQVSGANSTEELHYQYDTSGRLSNAAFAQTPETGYTDYSDPAATRARAYYEYDPAGRITELDHYWDTYTLPQGANSGYYDSTFILKNECSYEGTRGLKDHSIFYTGSGTATWTQVRDEEYGYDADLDYLVSADYDDGLSNATVTWTYDAAGNRASDSSNTGTWSYDALDRMTASPGVSYSNDILGNRTAKGSSISYGWDELNRMTSYTSGSSTTAYTYRADGMRVSKSDGTNSTTFSYDGQMPVEMKDVTGSSTAVTCQVPGARGLDWMQKTTGSGTVVAYPVYDAHGNMIATLSRSGSASYSLNDQRSYDAWGGIRSGNTSGDPKHQHCANLGHVADDESSLTCMRARVYEPLVGRFLSHDPDQHGLNSYSYCSNNPVSQVDPSGAMDLEDAVAFHALFMMALKIFFNASTNPYALVDLRMTLTPMRRIIEFTKLFAQSEMEAGELAGEAGGMEGAEILEGEGAKDMAMASAEELELKQVELMVEILMDEGYMP